MLCFCFIPSLHHDQIKARVDVPLNEMGDEDRGDGLMDDLLMRPKVDFAFKEIMTDERARIGYSSLQT